MLLFSPLLLSMEAQAKIYKCVNTEGKVYYNDKPCPVTSIEKEMKAAKDPVDGYVPPKFVPDAPEEGSKGIMIGDDSSREIDSKQSENAKAEASTTGGGGSNQNSSSGTNADTASTTSQSKETNNTSTASQNNTESANNSSPNELENVKYVESRTKKE